MSKATRLRGRACRILPAVVLALLIAGCARADKKESQMKSSEAAMSSSSKANSSKETMSAMGMEGEHMSVDGITPIPTQTLGTATWEGMKITARAMTPVPFVVYNGTSEHLVKPGKASFHLMVMLDDAHTGVAIPYASVWATIRKGAKIVSDARQWPMLARYMGPHYGNDVTVPGPGTYQLSLLISPPVSARHIEYQHVWLKPHEVNFTFHWKPT